MKTNYDDYHNIPVTIKVEESNGGIMITVDYSEEELQPECPVISEYGSHGNVTVISVGHPGLSGFHMATYGDDYIELEGETEQEIDLLENGRFFCWGNQILLLAKTKKDDVDTAELSYGLENFGKDAVQDNEDEIPSYDMNKKEWMILEAINYCNGIFPHGLIMFYKGVKITKQEFNILKKQLE